MSPSSSINLGIQKAKHCLIAYLDCGLAVPFNWLESSLDIINKYNCEMVSGKIYTEGSSYIDMSLVAQSYGYKNNTICLTGSLIKKEILKKLNYFLEECRASYDIDFINKFKKEKYVRKVNKDVIFKYYGINYSSNYFIALCKVFEYSKNGWEAYGDFKPIGYISLIIFIIFLPYNYYFYIFLLYFIIRGYLIPYYKSANFNFFKRIPLIFLLPISGFIFDIARLAGYIHSLPKVFINAK